MILNNCLLPIHPNPLSFSLLVDALVQSQLSGYLNIDVNEVVRALRAAVFKTALVGADLNAPPLPSETAAYTNAGAADGGSSTAGSEFQTSHHKHGGHRGHHGHHRVTQ